MGYSKSKLTTFLALTLLLIATPQPSQALTIDGINIARLEILGTLFCSVTGNPDPACGGQQCPRLNGALVTVSCFGRTTTLGQAVTDVTGAIRVVVSTVDSLVFDQSNCGVFVDLPVASCSVLPPTGVLTSALTLLDVVDGVTGGVARLTTGVFSVITGV
ncbi:hypothetical protein V2J09_014433 [Rumex salicifolius]